MAEPDDPLRADDPLVGAEHEDVLLGSGTAEEREPAAEHVDSVQDDLDENPTFVATSDDRPTTELPRVVAPTPAPEPTTWSGGVAPWAVFAAVAVVVIAATTTLASWLQGPTSERQGFTGLTQPFPTATSAPPAPVEAPAAPPSAEPEPEPEPEPAARPTQRPRATKAPAAPRPPAAAVNGRATPNGEEKEEPASTTSAPSLPAAADAGAAGTGAADTGAADTDIEKESSEADNAKPETDEDSDESEDG
ncbi:hypothetical protein FHX44_1110 [Pseudonocardia hierapolitana]|uniref:Uncharacterized protein n=1 Tax=Pseudonocardia hierapolitana TaxID=1128676 RepID=A0A561SGY3_9PSEU|nr:hypothetical protein FHX44_1110 [Pseudonocardia hierapolitana]